MAENDKREQHTQISYVVYFILLEIDNKESNFGIVATNEAFHHLERCSPYEHKVEWKNQSKVRDFNLKKIMLTDQGTAIKVQIKLNAYDKSISYLGIK